LISGEKRNMTARVRLVPVLVIALAARGADAGCPDRRASCILHEEGVALFLEGKHEEAAAKFAAAIAAEPTARSYLGYAQAVEALGKIALAYDTMVSAQRLSQGEVQSTGGKDVDVNARAERIKYKLGELRAKIGFVWLRVPEGVPPRRVISVQREGEGDLAQPLTQWTAVAPGRQVLIAKIDDGSKIEVIAEVAAGSQGVVVIPIAAPVRPMVPGRPGPPVGVFMPMPKPEPPINAYFAFGASLLAPGPENARLLGGDRASSGTGFSAFYERRVAASLGLATRLEYLFHGETDNFFNQNVVSGSEVIAMAGVRTMSSRTIHGRVGAGFTVYTQKARGPTVDEEFSRLYPALELGGGVHLGRLRLMMGLMFTANAGAEVSLGTRFMGSIGIDLYRK
jgi:hypothetical protein